MQPRASTDRRPSTCVISQSRPGRGGTSYLQARTAGFDEHSLEAAFNTIDIDRNGSLSPGEVRYAIKYMAPSLTEHDVTIMLACANADGEGGISLGEFTAMMLHQHEQDTRFWQR